MAHKIILVSEKDYPEILTVWEASVRATHHFLAEEDLLFYKVAIRDTYLPSGMLRLFCIREDNGDMSGFTGLSNDAIEMLFIRPDLRGTGIGKALLRYAVMEQQMTKVDVNEQNGQALGFYEHEGFHITGRSELDASGKPYPILHLSR